MSEDINTEPIPRSPEPPYKYERVTRDPNIPIRFEGDNEPKIHSVVLTKEYPHLPGQPYYLNGRCIIELAGDELKFRNYSYHSVQVKESLPNKAGEKLDEEFVKTYRDKIFYILTRNIEPTEKEKGKAKAEITARTEKEKSKPTKFNQAEWLKKHSEVVANDEWFDNEENKGVKNNT